MKHVQRITKQSPVEAQAGLGVVEILQLVLPLIVQLITALSGKIGMDNDDMMDDMPEA